MLNNTHRFIYNHNHHNCTHWPYCCSKYTADIEGWRKWKRTLKTLKYIDYKENNWKY